MAGVTLERATRLTPADTAVVLEFWVRAWTPVVPAIDFVGRRPWLAGHLEGLAAQGTTFLLARDRGGTPRGLLTLHPATGTVDQLAVDPDTGAKGIGRSLLAEAQRLAPAGGLHLSVNQDNPRAARFYRAAGFAVTGEAVNARSGLATWTMAWPAPCPGGE